MEFEVYLSGEIHSNWREEIIEDARKNGLSITFNTPVVTHETSDNVGVNILGSEEKAFWKDHKAAKINAIRIKSGIERSDLVIIKFGDKYRQWNAAFDAGQAAALGKPYIVIHPDEFTHALKEVDAQAMAVASNNNQVVEILKYLASQK
ncbi:YtoQ family protein [Fulvivirga sp. M361]|uniref:YtoQ family protein n=1 Tax=Fulvivirga sp. M361 TaxID=2594266 RepID=UPI00117A9953|nr:YtoQ family protein [Fulvivirga sp. M361]TRX52446.1 YtoQ family protein [Fulvivirga sp. M361]